MSNIRPFGSITRIPVIGATPVIIHDFRPSVVAQCTCGHGAPFLLTGMMESRKCDACERVFCIQGFAFDAAKAEASISVGLVPTPVVFPPSA